MRSTFKMINNIFDVYTHHIQIYMINIDTHMYLLVLKFDIIINDIILVVCNTFIL